MHKCQRKKQLSNISCSPSKEALTEGIKLKAHQLAAQRNTAELIDILNISQDAMLQHKLQIA